MRRGFVFLAWTRTCARYAGRELAESFSCECFLEELKDGGGVAVPGPPLGDVGRGPPHAGAEFRLFVEEADQFGECFGVVRVVKNKAIHTVVQK